MKDRSRWKQLTALLISAILLIPAPIASAAEIPSADWEQEESIMGQQEESGGAMIETDRAADADGFLRMGF